jgi:hypothetical protein
VIWQWIDTIWRNTSDRLACLESDLTPNWRDLTWYKWLFSALAPISLRLKIARVAVCTSFHWIALGNCTCFPRHIQRRLRAQIRELWGPIQGPFRAHSGNIQAQSYQIAQLIADENERQSKFSWWTLLKLFPHELVFASVLVLAEGSFLGLILLLHLRSNTVSDVTNISCEESLWSQSRFLSFILAFSLASTLILSIFVWI